VLFRSDSDFLLASLIAVLGNLAIAPAALYALEYVEKVVVKYGCWLGRVYGRALGMARRKSRKVEKYGILGLAVFVSIPLPATGAWTGSLVAHILSLPKLKSIVSIEIGVLIASAVVYAATILGVEFLKKLFFM
ncbi:MAG: small multi-drug export protein, partial [Sulfolobales archaeon]|nr:small multi-drug export protein [Sulfolobales archaeon]MDW8010891.1 small multi-drug export protein [Sulfolobales archaeon]